jgi:hypothetical protein
MLGVEGVRFGVFVGVQDLGMIPMACSWGMVMKIYVYVDMS